MDHLTNKIIIDSIGYISIIFSILSFLSLTTTKAKLFGIISTSLFGINIYFYNGYNGIFVSIISIIIKTLSFKLNDKQIYIIKLIAPLITIIYFFLFNTEGFIGIFPSISLIFIIIGDLQKDIIKMKFIYYGSAFSWLIYAIILNSIPAILFDIFGIITLTYSILKMKKLNYSYLKK